MVDDRLCPVNIKAVVRTKLAALLGGWIWEMVVRMDYWGKVGLSWFKRRWIDTFSSDIVRMKERSGRGSPRSQRWQGRSGRITTE